MANGEQTPNQVDALSSALEGLKKAQEDLVKSSKSANSAMSRQGSLAAELASAFNDTASGLDRLEESLGGVERGMKNAADAADDAEDRLGGLEKQVRSLTSAEERNAAGWKSFTGILDRAGPPLKLLGGLIGSVASGLFTLGKAIFMLPFRLLSGLVEFAADGGGGLELLEAYERVRKTFGDLASGPARDLVRSFRDVRSETGSLAGSGISLARVFGVGPGGLAAAMDFIREQAEGLGAQFQLLRGEFVESAAELIVFQKGMGLSTEQFKAFSTVAIGSGRDLTDTLGEVANLSIQLGDRFNLSAKQIAQGMATLATEFVAFGHLTQRELAATTVFAAELGVEIEALVKVAEKFSTFESAAEAASKLNQALGLQLDTMALLTADPAAQLKQIQDAFFATGRSVNELNRAERELLATQTGLSGADLAAALSPENAGKSLEEIRAAAEGAAEAPMTAEEAMNRLADSIERVFESGGGMKSFFDAFSQGFEQGLRWFGPTRQLFLNIRQSLRETRRAGREFARVFTTTFPGMIELVEGLRDAFNPARFREFLSKVISAFETFFTTLDPSNPGSSAGVFLDNMQNAFATTFGGEDGAGILQKLKDGFNNIATFLVNAFAGLVPHVVNGMVMLLNGMTNVLTGSSEAGTLSLEAGAFLSEELAAALNNAFDTLAAEAPRLAEPMSNLIAAVIESLKESGALEPALKSLGAYMVITMFGPSLIVSIGKAIYGAISGSAAVAGFKKGAGEFLEKAKSFFKRSVGGFAKAFGVIVSVVLIAVDTFKIFQRTTDEFGDKIQGFNALIGSFAAAIGNFLTLGFLSEDDQRYIVILTNDLIESFKEKWSEFKDFFANLWDTVKDGVREGFSGIKESVMSLGGDIVDSFKEMLGIRSPSTVFAEIGSNLIQGLVGGITSMATAPIDAIRGLGGAALRAIGNILPGGEGGAEGALGAAAQMFTAPLRMLQGQVESVVTAVRVVAEGVDEFRGMLNNLDDIGVVAELQQIGRSLGVNDGSVTVKTEPLNLTVNFQIRMDAEKVAAVLAGEPQRVISIENGGALARRGAIG